MGYAGRVWLGSTSVGKSQILMKFTKGTFNENAGMTVGVEFSAKNINVLGKNVRIQVWDTAGQEKFHVPTDIMPDVTEIETAAVNPGRMFPKL